MRGIVIEPLNLVYWMIPKCACTTIKVYLANLMGLHMPFGNPHRANFTWTYEPLTDYENIAIVRNPYSRLWSLYHNWDEEHSRQIYAKFPGVFEKGMSWDDYVDAIISIPDPDDHFKLQSQMVPDCAEVEKMETSVLLKLFEKHNTTGRTDYPKDNRIYEHYREDFDRFGYLK